MQPCSTGSFRWSRHGGRSVNVKQPDRFFSKTFSITRPNDTAVYAAGDVLSDSTSAPTIPTLTVVAPNGTGPVRLQGFSVSKSNTTIANLSLVLLIFSGTHAAINDNAAPGNDTEYTTLLGRTSTNAFTNAAYASIHGQNIVIPSSTISIIPIMLGAYTPVANETFFFKLDFERG